jgi:hypothetical protein
MGFFSFILCLLWMIEQLKTLYTELPYRLG